MWKNLNEKGMWQGEIWNRRKNGEEYLQWLNISAVKDESGESVRYVGTFTDYRRKMTINLNRLIKASLKRVRPIIERRKAISVKKSITKIMEQVRPLEKEMVPLTRSYRRILAEPIIAEHDIPRFNRSPYDGYAIRSADTKGADGENRLSFSIVDQIAAGSVSSVTLGPYEAVRIMTGAQMPKGADAVVMFEQAVSNERSFTIRKPFEPDENVSLQGEEVKNGEMLLPAGTLIHPGTVALLATFGYANVQVFKKPVIGILAVGTELLDVKDRLVPGKIRNSNGPMLAAQLERMGIESRIYKLEGNDLEHCSKTVEQALAEADCLITTGGVSVGDFDFLPCIYKKLEATVLFNKVAMRPGSVTTVATVHGKLLFGLSGNPSACFTGFELFVRPAILKMMGAKKPFLPHTKAILNEELLKPNPFTRFVRAKYNWTPSGPVVTSAGFNKSSAVAAIAKGNALLILPAGTKNVQAGSEVDVLLLDAEEGVEAWEL